MRPSHIYSPVSISWRQLLHNVSDCVYRHPIILGVSAIVGFLANHYAWIKPLTILSVNLTPLKAAVITYCSIRLGQGVREWYKERAFKYMDMLSREKPATIIEDKQDAFALGIRSAHEWSAIFKASISPTLWIYTERRNAYYAGQRAEQNHEVDLLEKVKSIAAPKSSI